MVELDKKEKKLLKILLEKELKEFEDEEETIRPNIHLLELEEKYDIFVKKILKKLE